MTKLRLLVVISAERTSRSLGEGSSLNEIESLKASNTPPPLPFLSFRKTL